MTITVNHPDYLPSVYDDPEGGVFCDATVGDPEDPDYICTRESGHDDDHAAHSGAGLQVHRWSGDDQKNCSPGDPNYLTPHDSERTRSCGVVEERPDGLGYMCTRSAGHDGDHAAHILNNDQIARWPREMP